MPELIRPSPPVSWRERAAGALGAMAPARLFTAAGALLIVGAAAWWLLRAPAASVEDRLPMAAAAARTTVAAAGASTAVPRANPPEGGLVVQAAGAVARPGVYRVAAGARVADLLQSAGGPLPEADLDAVALAAKLTDGQRVYVPRAGEAVPALVTGGGDTTGSPSPTAPVDLNTATADQLDGLPGVGPATAAAIIAYRDKHGRFRSVEGLLDVRGIGPAKLDQLRDLVTV